jgi:hypothetical protein
MFIRCNSKYAILAATRCGHTNMYYYHGMEAYSEMSKFGTTEWREHHNPIVVLRHPLDRVRSATSYATQDMILLTTDMHRNLIALGEDEWSEAKTFRYAVELGKENYKQSMHALYSHSFPYMNNVLVGVNFRIIDFYELSNYVPRRDELFQSRRTDSYLGDSFKAEDVYVENVGYSLEDLQQEVDLYKDFMANKERVSPDEWKEMTKGRFGSD